MSKCFHCGLPASSGFSVVINNQRQEFCCLGCQAVAIAIHEGGLENYYRFREKPAIKATQVDSSFQAFNLPDVQESFVTSENAYCTARLAIDGISCAACAWLIEHQLEKLEGVDSIRVNATTRQALVKWRQDRIQLSDIFSGIAKIGYNPAPASRQQAQQQRQKEYRQSLMRLGVAGIGMMQVGMVAVAMYAGGEESVGQYWQALLRWVSLIVATPVVFYSAMPFFKSAFRSLLQRHLNMDVPVTLALALAYVASCWATINNTGDVYFDSVAMFTFFLLLGRFLEMRARHSSAFECENLTQLLPPTAHRLCDNQKEEIPLQGVKVGDTLWVGAGETLPADGVLKSHFAQVDESLLTGESELVNKSEQDLLVAGTLNGDTALELLVTATGKKTQLAAIDTLVERAELDKPNQVTLADKVAARFVAAVLVIAVIAFSFWWIKAPSQAVWVVLSILVVTCPCALSLATPAAVTAGLNRSRKIGVLITANHAMEAFSNVTDVIFDKTGTLTRGELRVEKVVEIPAPTHNRHNPILIISSLEQHSHHPIARAFKQQTDAYLTTSAVVVFGGEGVEGVVDGVRYRFGKKAFCLDIVASSEFDESLDYPDAGMWQLLANEKGPVAWVKLSDQLRQTAAAAVAELSKTYKNLALLSGDRSGSVDNVAKKLCIPQTVANATPHSKLQWLQALQAKGAVTLMVGDGINDAPVLSAADVSVAMGSATQLAQTKADAVLLSGDLTALPKVLQLSLRVKYIIRQNLYWAIGYNLVALPAAAAGLIPPWLAAIGMSASSIIVVLNAMRI